MGLDITITIKTTSHDFCKRNWLIPFVEKAIGKEIENCEEYELSKETMFDLLDRIDKVLADHDLAEELLPTQDGYFYGSTQYNDWYFENLQDAKYRLEEDVKSMDDNETAIFWSWWW